MNEKTEKVISALKDGLESSDKNKDVKLFDIMKKLTNKRESVKKN